MKSQFRSHHDHRATRIVHTLTEEILAESPALPLQHVRKRLQGALARTCNNPTPPPIIEKSVNRFLKHPLLVADNNLRRVQLLQPFEPVIPIDHPPVEVVEIARRKTTSIQGDQRAEIGRNYGDNFEDHKFRTVDSRFPECVHDLKALGNPLAFGFARRLPHFFPQELAFGLDIKFGEEFANRLRPDPILKGIATVFFAQFDQAFVIDQFAFYQFRVLGVGHEIGFEVENFLQIPKCDLQNIADAGRQRLQKPDMRNRRGQSDMPHPFTPHL